MSANMQIAFRTKFPWALPPYKPRVDKKTADADAEMYAENFRWVRRGRLPERCIPWRLAHATGWIIPSPIDVQVSRVVSVPLALSAAERSYLLKQTGMVDVWPSRTHDSSNPSHALVTETTDWLELYEAKCGETWENIFHLLSDGFVEWSLGWEMDLPPGYHVMALPIFDPEEIEVASGPIDASAVSDMNGKLGMTLVIRPRKTVAIRRRQPIAQMVLLHDETITAQARFETVDWRTAAMAEE